jgi:hypothetical protein
MDIRSLKHNSDYNLTKSVSGYLNTTEQFYSKSESQISEHNYSRRPSMYESKRDEVKSYTHINKLYEQRPYSIED